MLRFCCALARTSSGSGGSRPHNADSLIPPLTTPLNTVYRHYSNNACPYPSDSNPSSTSCQNADGIAPSPCLQQRVSTGNCGKGCGEGGGRGGGWRSSGYGGGGFVNNNDGSSSSGDGYVKTYHGRGRLLSSSSRYSFQSSTVTYKGDVDGRCVPALRGSQQHRTATVQLSNNQQAKPIFSTSVSHVGASNAAAPCRSFWSQRVRHVSAAELKRQHMMERAHDKRSRFHVRSRIRDDGVVSNLFPVFFHDDEALRRYGEKEDPYVYIYEMYVTRLVQPKVKLTATTTRGSKDAAAAPLDEHTESWKSNRSNCELDSSSPSCTHSSAASASGVDVASSTVTAATSVERRVSPGRSWHAIQRYLRQRYTAAAANLLPPLIQLDNKIYAARPLPADALQLPKTYFDIGWKAAELRLISRKRYADFPASELQKVLNKIVLELARETQRRDQRRRNTNNNSSNEISKDGGAEDLGVLEVVREKTGKLVCTMQGLSAGGVRVYRGVYVQAVFVDDTAALAYESEANEGEEEASNASSKTSNRNSSTAAVGADSSASFLPSTPATRHLADTPVGLTDADKPIQFRVDAFLRAITYCGTPVESYRISDAAGSVLASVWNPPQPQSLIVGAVYAVAPVRIREFAERGNARLVEIPSGTVPRLLASPVPSQSPPSPQQNTQQQQQRRTSAAVAGDTAAGAPGAGTGTQSSLDPPSRHAGHISLKIDTKGTVASEISLWDEVLQHYGPGPFDEPTQQRIRKALTYMPVVISYSLRQGIVREVRFDGGAVLAAAAAGDPLVNISENLAARTTVHAAGSSFAAHACSTVASAPSLSHDTAKVLKAELTRPPYIGSREPRLLPLLPFLDSQQPCAVLADYTVVPLQVLHCCFEPSVKGRQDVGVAALSLMPNQRMQLLNFVQQLLARGLRQWGIEVARRPWRTKSLSLLPTPMKCVLQRPSRCGNVSAVVASVNNPLLFPQPVPPANTGTAAVVSFPSTIAVIGVAGPRCTADQAQRISRTVQHMAQYFRTNLVACVADESAGVQYVHSHLTVINNTCNNIDTMHSSRLHDVNSCVILITTEPDTRATRWLKVECMCRGIHVIALLPSASTKQLSVFCGGLRRQIATQFELDPLRGVDLRGEVPVLGRRRILIIGVDTCHTNTHSIGTIVGILSMPRSNHVLSHFWVHDARGREASNVALHFKNLLAKVLTLHGGVDEVVVFQDGDVFSELAGVKDELAAQLPGCGLTFMCLHKRCNVRFTHTSFASPGAQASRTNQYADGERDQQKSYSHVHKNHDSNNNNCTSVEAGFHNIVKGVVIAALAPVPLDYEVAAPSFYLQAHESAMSTARAVQYTVHHVSPTLDVADVQQMANVMANVMAPQATKLPMSTRCAHRLADRAERLVDAVPQFTGDMIPRPLSDRLWFL